MLSSRAFFRLSVAIRRGHGHGKGPRGPHVITPTPATHGKTTAALWNQTCDPPWSDAELAAQAPRCRRAAPAARISELLSPFFPGKGKKGPKTPRRSGERGKEVGKKFAHKTREISTKRPFFPFFPRGSRGTYFLARFPPRRCTRPPPVKKEVWPVRNSALMVTIKAGSETRNTLGGRILRPSCSIDNAVAWPQFWYHGF